MTSKALRFALFCSTTLAVSVVFAQTPSVTAPHDSGESVLENRNSTPAEIDKTNTDVSDNAQRGASASKKSGGETVSAMNDADKQFVMDAAKAGATEIEASRLAIKNAKNPKVKAFANHMIGDHTKLAEKLSLTVRKQNGDAPAAQPDAETMSLLKSLKGEDFDQAYIEHVAIDGHRKAVDVFDTETTKGSNAALKSLARGALPTIKHHLKMGQDFSKVSASGAAADAGMGTMKTN